MNYIDAVSKFQYDAGADPVDWACDLVQLYVECRDQIRAARAHTPGAYPVYLLPLTDDVLARQIVGRLLDAGWTPPNVGEAS